MRISVDELRDTATRAIRRYGYDEADAATILEVLMYAQLRGNNQGVVKLIGAGIPRDGSATEISVEHRGTTAALVDGHGNHAMVVVNRAVDEAVALAGRTGIGLVGVNHVSTSSGAIGYYTRRIATHGYIGVVLAGSPPTVAPAGSYQPVFGTNPLSIAVPSESEPIVLDMATAAMAFYGVIEAKTAGRALPDGIAYDADGRLTTDPAAAMDGALRTFDAGHRGSGLSFMVQALTGPLVGAAFAGIGDVERNWGGHLVIAIDPGLLTSGAAVRAGVTEMTDTVKRARRLPGVAEIFVPGERGDRRASMTTVEGMTDIDDELYRQLRLVAFPDEG
jgi:L-2-hydroxycarboxylate dehydrogenase (NAD+)